MFTFFTSRPIQYISACWHLWCCPLIPWQPQAARFRVSHTLFIVLSTACSSLSSGWQGGKKRVRGNLRQRDWAIDKSLPTSPFFPPTAGEAQSHTGIKDIVYRQEKALSSSFTPFSQKVLWESDRGEGGTRQGSVIQGWEVTEGEWWVGRAKKRAKEVRNCSFLKFEEKRDKAKEEEHLSTIQE